MGNEQSTQQAPTQENTNEDLAQSETSDSDIDLDQVPLHRQDATIVSPCITNDAATEPNQREEDLTMAIQSAAEARIAETPQAQLRHSSVQRDEQSSKKKNRRGRKGGALRKDRSSVTTSSPSISRTTSHDDSVRSDTVYARRLLPEVPRWPNESSMPKSSSEQAMREKEPEMFGEYARSEDGSVTDLPEREAPKSPQPRWSDSPAAQNKQDGQTNRVETQLQVSNPLQTYEDIGTDSLQQVQSTQQSNREAREPRRTSNGKFACPYADEYACEKVFASKKSARRHGDSIHLQLQSFVCMVCGTSYFRADQLKTHYKKEHSPGKATVPAMQKHIAAASSPEAPEPNEEANSIEAETKQSSLADEHMSDNEVTQPQEEPVSLSSDDDANGRMSSEPTPRKADTVTASAAARSIEEDGNSSESGPGDGLHIQENRVALTGSSKLKRKFGLSTPSRRGLQTPTTLSKKRRTNNIELVPESSPEPGVAQLEPVRSQEDRGRSVRLPKLATQKTTKAPGANTGPLDGYIKPLLTTSTTNSFSENVHLPVKARQVEVIIPRSSQATSSRPQHSQENGSSGQASGRYNGVNGRLSRPTKRPYTTAKGKGKARAGVDYSSPKQDEDTHSDLESGPSSDEEEPEMRQIATSVARRSSKVVNRLHRGSVDGSPLLGASEKDTDSSGGSVYSDAPESSVQTFAEIKPTRIKQERKPPAEKGPGLDARKGTFTDKERSKLNKWRDNFCKEYDIEEYEFNDMMTQSCRRGKQHIWSWQFITKEDFLKEYYDLLPDRDRRSMHRYRERNFQNVAAKQEWTTADDDELERLQILLGAKWVEIGLRMNRTQDSVYQRWKNKIQYRGKRNEGEWDPKETKTLKEIVARVKRQSGLSPGEQSDDQIPWTAVSEAMGKTRTAQQCSNKWRLLFQVKKKGRFYKTPSTVQSRIPDSEFRTPSKMENRLVPKRSSASNRSKSNLLSEEYVQNSDEDDDNDLQEIQEKRSSQTPHSESRAVMQDPQSSQDEIGDESDTSEDENDDAESDSEEQSRSESSSAVSASQKGLGQSKISAETPLVSKNPFVSKTPAHQISTSQAFNETQANTSARRTVINQPLLHMHSEERPSPSLLIQHRRLSSPLLGFSTTPLGQNERASSLQERSDAISDPVQDNDVGSDDESGSDITSSDPDTAETPKANVEQRQSKMHHPHNLQVRREQRSNTNRVSTARNQDGSSLRSRNGTVSTA